MPTRSRHCHLEHWTFEYLGFDNNVLTFFVIDSLELSLALASDKLRTSTRNLLLA